MIVAFLDFETTGLDLKTLLPTEVGCLLYEWSGGAKCFVPTGSSAHSHETTWLPRWRLITSFNELIWNEHYPKQTEQIVELTGITDEMLKEKGRAPQIVFADLLFILKQADIIVAHQAQFDKGVLEEALKPLLIPMPEKEWLCTRTNFDWAPKFRCQQLAHLAFDHGLFDHPTTFDRKGLHRATDDCLLLHGLVACYDFAKVLEYAREPYLVLRALIAKPWDDGGVEKGIAQSVGFSWERIGHDMEVYPKWWVRRVKASRLNGLKEKIALSKSPFEVQII